MVYDTTFNAAYCDECSSLHILKLPKDECKEITEQQLRSLWYNCKHQSDFICAHCSRPLFVVK